MKAAATSSGDPTRLSGILSRPYASTNAGLSSASFSGVRMNPGTDAVDADAVAAELHRHRPRELEDAALRGVVVGQILLAAEGVRRRHVQDHAAAARHHAARGRLGDHEDAAEVDREHAVPIGERRVQEGRLAGDACVVDEHLDDAERGLRLGERSLDARLVAHVTGCSGGEPVGPELGDGGVDLGGLEPAHVDAGALLEKAPRGREADPARAAGNEGPFPGEPAQGRQRNAAQVIAVA